jgi:hypothetical protein
VERPSSSESETSIESNKENEDEWQPSDDDPELTQPRKKSRNTMDISDFIQTGARFDSSQREMASLGNAFVRSLKKAGIEIPEEMSFIGQDSRSAIGLSL